MTNIFVLDENVIIEAFTGQNSETREDDFSCLGLIHAILSKCDSIVLDPYLQGKFREKIDQYRGHMRGMTTPSPVRLLEHMMNNPTKHRIVQNLEPLEEERDCLPEDDAPIVRLAVKTQSIFVSNDSRLADRVRQHGVDKKYRLRMVRPFEALQLVGTRAPVSS